MKLNYFCSGTILSPEKTTTKSSEYLIRRPLKLLERSIHFSWVLTYSINLFQSWDLDGRSLYKILLLSLHFRMCLTFTVPDITTLIQIKCRKKYTESYAQWLYYDKLFAGSGEGQFSFVLLLAPLYLTLSLQMPGLVCSASDMPL